MTAFRRIPAAARQSLCGLVCLLVTGSAASPATAVEVKRYDTELIALESRRGMLRGIDTHGDAVSVWARSGNLEFQAAADTGAGERPPDILPDGEIARGRGAIARAWLAGPTRRYDHAVLGDGLEAMRLVVVDSNGVRHALNLPEHQVFEDRYPRLVDLIGGPDPELAVIRSDVDRGAAVAVYGMRAGALVELAASEPIGRRHRWLNIVGAGDFDDDAHRELAVVVTPHIGGVLTLMQVRGNRLETVFSRRGFSNHEYGSRELGMSAVADLNGDGVPDLAVPDTRRRALIVLTFAGGGYHELARVDNPASIHTGVHVADLDGDGASELVYLLEDGTLVSVAAAPP